MGYDKLYQKKKLEKDLVRHRAKRSLRNILIVGEGKTEYNYFNDLRRCHRHTDVNLILQKPKGSAPISIVDFAIDFAHKNEDVDYVFCIFDRDEHSTYDAAVVKLKDFKSPRSAKSKPKFKAIISVPCFELWLLLHFEFSTKYYFKDGNKTASEHVSADLREHLPDYSKTMINLFQTLQARLEMAKKNAKKLLAHNEQTGSTNPSTNMHELIERIT